MTEAEGPRRATAAPFSISALLVIACAVGGGRPAIASPDQDKGWAVGVQGGYSPSRYEGDKDGTGVITLAARSQVAPGWFISLGSGVLRYTSDGGTTFIAASAGVRFRFPNGRERAGLFVEAMPSLYLARWNRNSIKTSRVLAGFQEAAGFELPLAHAMAVEVSVGYMQSAGAKEIFYDSTPEIFEGLSQTLIRMGISLAI